MTVRGSPSASKIDIGTEVYAAYAVVANNARRAIDLARLPFAILIGLEIIAWLLGGTGPFGIILASLVRDGGFTLFDTVFIVRWHRFILLGETATGHLFPLGWGSYFLTGIKLSLLLSLGALLLVGIIISARIVAIAPLFLRIIEIAGGVILVLLAARVLLALPAAAILRPISLVGDAWDLPTGNYWRLVACLIACGLPFGIMGYIVGVIGDTAPSILRIVFELIGLAVSFAGIAVAASLLSDIYRLLQLISTVRE